MYAFIGIGFETTFKKFIELGDSLGIPKNKASFRKEVKTKLDYMFSTDLLIFYSKQEDSVVFLEKILSTPKQFKIIDTKQDISSSEEFNRVKEFVDTSAIVGLCAYATNELPERYHTIAHTEGKKYKS